MIRAENLRCPDLDAVMALMIDGDDRVPLLGGVDRLPRDGRVARTVGALARRPRRRSTTCRRSCDATRCTSRRRRCSRAPPWAPNGSAQPVERRRVQRVLVPRHAVAARARREHLVVLPPARRRARTGTASTGAAASCSTSTWCPTTRTTRCARSIEMLSEAARGVVPRGAQALRARQPGAAVVPAARLDPRARHPGDRPRPGRAARPPRRARGRRRRAHLPGQGLPPAARAARR